MKHKILPGILFVLLAIWVCFIGGLIVGGLVTPTSAGLAGGATVFFYGVMGGILALLFGALAARQAPLAVLKKMLIGMGILTLLSGVWIAYKVIQQNDETHTQPEVTIPLKPTEQTTPIAHPISYTYSSPPELQTEMGLGMASVPFQMNRSVVYFYDGPGFEVKKIDSLVINGPNALGYGPAWLFPEMTKVDYQIILFRVLAVSRYKLQVVANQQTGQTAWMNREEMEFEYWPDFLLDVFAVEATEPQHNLLRVKPLSHAGISSFSKGENGDIPQKWSFMNAVAVKGDWLRVELIKEPNQILGLAWIRWRKDGQLWVRWNMLS